MFKLAPMVQHAPSPKLNPKVESNESSKSSGGIFGFGKSKKKEKGKIDKSMISAPENFQ